ncbi:TonB-dependent receptor [Flavobacteriaceae bacterium AU392]|nr:TonB-dependent receptor [Flavobacteriaceae bacterium]RKM84603.1 TonB-dependent receptor [Flavobacteriaceae bacterium AU392]
MKKITLLFILLTATISYAQNTGSIVGKLIDKEYNNEPLAFANIIIKGTIKGTTSDIDGLYKLENLEPGDYIIQYSFVGYETQEINATVVAGKVTTINVPMGASAASLDEVIITTTTRRESEVALLLDQKKAVEIKQSIGSQELARKGVSDAAGAISLISGISKQEGSSNVYVRGLGDRYQNTTLNGLSLPSNDIDKKNIDLSLFSSDVIENVSVSKTYSTRSFGDFAAGNVDISSKDYKGKGFINFTSGSSINSRAVNQNFVRSEGTGFFGYYGRNDNNPFAVVISQPIDPVNAGEPVNINFGGSAGISFDIGKASRLSLFATASFENGFEYRRGEAANFTTVITTAFPDAEEFEYSTTTTALANINYKINDKHKIKYNSLFVNSSSDQVGNFGINGGGQNRNAIANADEGFYQKNIQFDQDIIIVNQLIGTHNINEKLKLDWGIGYNKVFANQPDRKRLSLENFQLSLDNDPSTNPTFFNNIPFDNQRYFQDIEDDEFTSRLNLEYTLNEKIKLNIGHNSRIKERAFDNIRYGYDIVDRNFQITDVNNFDAIFNVENLSLSDGGGIFRTFVFNAINPPQVGPFNRPGLPENTYTGRLELNAGYANAEININEKLLIVPGVRVEFFDQSIDFDVINLPPNDPGFREVDNTFFLPSLNVRYALNENQNLRFSASKTVSVPEFKEVAPFVYEGVTTRIGGNPDLLDGTSFSKIYNVDLKYEWFLSKNELLSVAVFGKQINDPVNLVVANDATGTQRYFRTGDRADVFGVELELRKNIIQDGDENTKLSFGFNATYTYTEQDLRSSNGLFSSTLDRTDQLQGASPLIINADLNYTPTFGKYKPKANLVFNYFSDRIDALGSGQLGNIVEKSVPTLDFILKNDITEKLELNFSAKNIFDSTIQYVREDTPFGDISVTSANGKGITNYKRGVDIGFQLKYKF